MVYTDHQPLIFEWDDDKALANERKHRIPFDVAVRIFLDPDRIDFDASRDEEGEERRKVVGQIENKLFCLVYTRRAGGVIRIISARRANLQEIRRYDNPLPA